MALGTKSGAEEAQKAADAKAEQDAKDAKMLRKIGDQINSVGVKFGKPEKWLWDGKDAKGNPLKGQEKYLQMSLRSAVQANLGKMASELERSGRKANDEEWAEAVASPLKDAGFKEGDKPEDEPPEEGDNADNAENGDGNGDGNDGENEENADNDKKTAAKTRSSSAKDADGNEIKGDDMEAKKNPNKKEEEEFNEAKAMLSDENTEFNADRLAELGFIPQKDGRPADGAPFTPVSPKDIPSDAVVKSS